MTSVLAHKRETLHVDPMAGPPSSEFGHARIDPPLSIAVESFGAVYREHYASIAGLIYRRTGNAHATEDLTSDVFVSAFAGIHRYRGEIPVVIWLRRIAHNRVNRWARREAGLRGILRRLPGLRSFLPAPEPASERFRALEALLRLPVRHQEVISAHHLEGMSLEEVGLMLGVSVDTVKSRLARARAAMKRELEQHGKGETES